MSYKKIKKKDPLKPPMPRVPKKGPGVVECYTDGGCYPNGAPENKGGYAFIVVEDDTVLYQYSRGVDNTTNNKMELQAMLDCLQYIKENIPADTTVIIHTDSQYCLHGICTWYVGWECRNWSGVKNSDQWQQIIALKREMPNVHYLWIRAHQTDSSKETRYNNMTDRLCSQYTGEQYTEEPVPAVENKSNLVASIRSKLAEIESILKQIENGTE